MEEWQVNDWRIRLSPGSLFRGDTRVWVATPGGEYSLLHWSTLGWIMRWLMENEEARYWWKRGAKKPLDFFWSCYRMGVDAACDQHDVDRPKARRIR